MGPARSGSGLHVDPLATSAWNALVAGHKRWALFPPGTPRHHVLPKLPGLEREAVSWFTHVYPLTQRLDWPTAKPIDVIQVDCLFIMCKLIGLCGSRLAELNRKRQCCDCSCVQNTARSEPLLADTFVGCHVCGIQRVHLHAGQICCCGNTKCKQKNSMSCTAVSWGDNVCAWWLVACCAQCGPHHCHNTQLRQHRQFLQGKHIRLWTLTTSSCCHELEDYTKCSCLPPSLQTKSGRLLMFNL